MAHVYRAVWTDDLLNVERAVPDCVEAWLRNRNTIVPITMGAVEHVGPRTLVAVEVAGDFGTGVQITLIESPGHGRGTWTTVINGMTVGGTRVLWVDVHAKADNIWQRSIWSPRIVRELLLAGGEPRAAGEVIEVQPREVDDEESLGLLVGSLADETRAIPHLVLAAGEGFDRNRVVQRATRASDILAGVAIISVVHSAWVGDFNAMMPEGLELDALSARLYMPGATADPSNVRLSAFYADDDIAEDHTLLGTLVTKKIGNSSLWPEVPAEWTRCKKKLDDRRRVLIRKSPAVTGETLTVVKEDEVSRLSELVQSLQDELLDANILAWEWYERARIDQDRVVSMLLSKDSTPSFARPTLAATIEEVGRLAKKVVIAPSAPREIESLDSHASAGVWAADLARLFASMERYAAHRASRGFEGNYRGWCIEHGDYPDSKIALQESQSTKSQQTLRDKRTFEVPREVSRDGKMVMLSHAKIQLTGSGYIPRVFFHDDTGGVTGKVHIGFIGPHYLVPTSSF